MKHIVAIGGGEIGRPGYSVETTDIDKQIVSLSAKTNPNVLFLPTASTDSTGYYEVFNQYYGKRLGCNVTVLNLYSKPTKTSIEHAIEGADVIYVGGGNTLKMMMLWRRIGLDKLLAEAYENGTVLCGLSAGAICWFRGGLSDSRSYTSGGKVWNYINVHGLDLEDLLICPHFDVELGRPPALKKMLEGTKRVAIALDNCTALQIQDDTFRILRSKQSSKAYKAYWSTGDYIIEPLPITDAYASLNLLGRQF
jgi:dipeptidase E